MALTRSRISRADPMSLSGTRRFLSLILACGVFGVYLFSTSPVVYLGDSGELTAAAFCLGIPHNSGYPLYSLIGKIFCLIPIGNVGFRLNLMSAFFSALAVLLVCEIILSFTRNACCAAVGAAYLAFTPLFWSQTVSAEVYPLHLFCLCLMIRLMWEWDQTRSFNYLLLFVFVTGLSFGNHMQTVMLAVPVLYFIISGDKQAIFAWRHFAAITLCFILPLTLYLYLPIRTQAGAAIHWGDPDTLERFLAHVTATAHRSAYVFSKGPAQYLERLIEALKVIVTQYGVLLLVSFWGWIRLGLVRWQVLFLGIILFDLFYTVFLNIISFEITPFTLPSSVVLAILVGIGLHHLLEWVRSQQNVGQKIKEGVVAAVCAIPAFGLITNYRSCDQSRNYIAYEHAVNVFRTVPRGGTLFLDGDNNVFPVAYGRIVEGMGNGISLYDRHNVIFKWRLPTYPFIFAGTWNELESSVIQEIIHSQSRSGVYFAAMNAYAISIPPDYRLVPCGILRKVVPEQGIVGCPAGIWDYYATEGYQDDFNRDYMNREATSRYYFTKGESLWLSGRRNKAMSLFNLASRIGYNDTSIHSDLGVFFTDQGLFEYAGKELEKALIYYDDLSGIYNNWGYFYHKRGDYLKAIASFKKAIELCPQNHAYHNNLAFTFYEMGEKKEARERFQRSLAINQNQPAIKEFMRKHGM
ncbi:MAG: hypothetical protein B5M55_01345 [Desulfococcus sp. 4484_242]|nr:MAG: hypothetical protein B5M55_01345 [Desulfococcus sp. 4484_242]